MKLVESEKNNWRNNKVVQISEKGYGYLLHRMHSAGHDGYQNFLRFALVFT